MKRVCTYCGSSRNVQDDHLKAKVSGGVTTIPACAKCNQSKGKKGVMEWFRWLVKNRIQLWRKIVKYNYGKRNKVAQMVHKVRDYG